MVCGGIGEAIGDEVWRRKRDGMEWNGVIVVGGTEEVVSRRNGDGND